MRKPTAGKRGDEYVYHEKDSSANLVLVQTRKLDILATSGETVSWEFERTEDPKGVAVCKPPRLPQIHVRAEGKRVTMARYLQPCLGLRSCCAGGLCEDRLSCEAESLEGARCD